MSIDYKKVLITGGTGLVGSAFQDGLKIGSEIDLREYDTTYELIGDLKPDVVVHTAAKVGGVLGNMKYPADFFSDNIRMNTNVIDACRKHDVKKLICFLSTCVFPDKVDYPLDETKIQTGPPHESNFAYAYAKRMAEVHIQATNKQFGTKYFSVIPTNIYGPNDNFNLETGHVIPMLIHKCYLAKKENKPFEVWGSGTPLREFISSKDVVNVINILIEKYDKTEPVIISSSVEHSIKELVELIVKYSNFRGDIKWLTDKPDGQFRKPSSNNKLLSVIGDYEFEKLDYGINRTIEWFETNYETIRK